MMVSVETYLRRRQRQFQQWTQVPGVRECLQLLGSGAGGFVLSAASLGGSPQSFAMGFCCAASGWQALSAGLGSMLGYHLFWGQAGLQPLLWAGTGTAMALALRRPRICHQMPMLIPAMAAFLVSVLGLVFQVLWLDETPFGIYVLRVALTGASVLLFEGFFQRSPPCLLLSGGLFVLSLSRIAPVSWLNFGYLGCGALITGQNLSSAVLAGLGLDLARVTEVPMTAVACLSSFSRLMPLKNPLYRAALPCAVYIGIMWLLGCWDPAPLPALALGSLLGVLLPVKISAPKQSSGAGYAQVQLELAAGVMAETQQLLLETADAAIDETALLEKAVLRGCGNCVLRNDCRERGNLSVYHLHHPLDFACRKPGRILGELRRSREQMLSLRREKGQQQEYRMALSQQYHFLWEYLQSLADDLQHRSHLAKPRYRILVSARTRGKNHSNGDVCLAFPGTKCRYYVALCDGMGTGPGAAMQGRGTAALLKKMLTAGLSPQQAFRSINSILVLRGQAGMVTLDLAELELTTGRGRLYKWGAAPSWLLDQERMERIGYATPPPGISVCREQESVYRFSLSRGETLILLSDGADIQEAVLRGKLGWDMAPAELAETILKFSRIRSEDDSTAAVLRLCPISQEATASQPP